MDAPHILWFVPAALAAGFALLWVNMHGAGGRRALARTTYNAGTGADLIHFIDLAKQRFGELPLYMIGYSLGGKAALNMALDYPEAAGRLAGLVTVGSPIDMMITARKFQRHRNWLYLRYILSGMKQIITTTQHLEQRFLDTTMRASTVFNFVDHVTTPLTGYRDATTYHTAITIHHRLT